MTTKDYTLVVGRWDEVVSKPTDPVYLTETHLRGDTVSLDPRSENGRRLIGIGAVVEKGQEDDELKAEIKAKQNADPDQVAPPGFASPEAAQGSGVQRVARASR